MYNAPYKNLKIWQKAMELAGEAYRITREFPNEELYALTSQIRRSAISIPSNIAEGSRRVSDKEFANFILIARGSLAEMETQFLLAIKFNYVSGESMDDFLLKADELDKMIFSFHSRLHPKLPARSSKLPASC